MTQTTRTTEKMTATVFKGKGSKAAAEQLAAEYRADAKFANVDEWTRYGGVREVIGFFA